MKRSLITVALILSAVGCSPKDEQAVLQSGSGVDPALVGRANTAVASALSSDDEVMRCHGIEVIGEAPPADVDAKLTTALNDRSPLVRKAAAITIGRLKRTSFLNKFGPVLDDYQTIPKTAPDDVHTGAYQERLAGIFALHRLGEASYTHEFEKALVDPRPAVRRDAVFLLGLLEEPSAAPLLFKRLHEDENPHVRIQAAEAMWRLHDAAGMDALVTATISSDGTLQMEAALGLAGPRDGRVVGNIEGMFNADYPEVRIVAARAAGMLGSTKGYSYAIKAAADKTWLMRHLAALALGDIGKPEGLPVLSKLLDDPQPEVRIAAAQGVLVMARNQR